MKAIGNFICTPSGGRRYDNIKVIEGIEFITSTSEEDHKSSNRLATVEQIPAGYNGPIKKGDTLLVHHNVFKYYNDINGQRKSGKSFFKEDQFLVDFEQFFMYKNESGWHSNGRYCFIKPIRNTMEGMYNVVSTYPLVGELMYPSDDQIKSGLKSGDIVCFTPNSEYEFIVDGEKMYRVFDHQVTIKLDEQEYKGL
jgi:hypothetical protein